MNNVKKRSPLFIVIRIGVLAYVGMVLVLAGCQRHFIYHPSQAGEEELLRLAPRVGLEEWRDGQGELIGWKHIAGSHPEQVRRVLVFHGNAGMAVHRTYYVDGFYSTPEGERWQIYLFEYPGYGARPGRPGEIRFYEAARQAVKELLAEGEHPLFIVGESLGSGVASRMAAEFGDDLEGLLLVTPFTSLADVGARHFWGFPVRLLLRERYDNIDSLETYRGPVAILLAEYDEVVPADLGQTLYDTYEGPKKLWIQEGRNHNSLDLSERHSWWEEMTHFLLEAAGE